MADLYDENVLLALFDEEHEKHDLVNAWFDRNLDPGWASCPLTQNGYSRVRSQPTYTNPLSLAEAYGQLLDATSSQHHQFIADDISLLDGTLIQFRDLAGPRQLTDVYLLALAVAHDARLVTLDSRISLVAVRSATPSHLTIVRAQQ